MSDFTNGDSFLSYLSSFWTQLYGSPEMIRGISDANALQLQQIYQDFVEAVNRLSIRKIDPFHKELFYPIVLKRPLPESDQEKVAFGDGVVFGAQPEGGEFTPGAVFTYGGFERRSGLYYAIAPDNLSNLGTVIINRLTEPSVVLLRDSDWSFAPGSLAFKQDPFDNPLIPRRAVAGVDGAIEEELVLWTINALVDKQDIYRKFGFPFTNIKASSEFYRRALELTMKAYAGGPTQRVLDSMVAAFAQVPLTREVTETIQKIDSFRGETLVITDANVYRVPGSMTLRPSVVEGAILRAGQPLTTATEVVDRTINPKWWASVPGMALSRDFISADITSLGFLNEAFKVEPEDEINTDDGSSSGRPARFYLAGSSRDVKNFWDAARKNSAAQGIFLGDLLWKDAGLVNVDGSPDFTQDLYINPFEALVTRLIGDGLIVVKIRISDFDESIPLFQNLRLLREVIPVWCSLVVFIDLEASDSYATEGSVQVGTSILVKTTDLIRGRVSGFDSVTKGYFLDTDDDGVPLTPIPEALSVDDSPAIIRETLDFGDPDAHGSGVPVCEEQISVTTEKICN